MFPKDPDMRSADALARELAEEAVQSIADSEPDGDTIEAQELLSGTPFERMYVLHGAEIINRVHTTLSNAFYDGQLRRPSADSQAEWEEQHGTAVMAQEIWNHAHHAIGALRRPAAEHPEDDHLRGALERLGAIQRGCEALGARRRAKGLVLLDVAAVVLFEGHYHVHVRGERFNLTVEEGGREGGYTWECEHEDVGAPPGQGHAVTDAGAQQQAAKWAWQFMESAEREGRWRDNVWLDEAEEVET